MVMTNELSVKAYLKVKGEHLPINQCYVTKLCNQNQANQPENWL